MTNDGISGFSTPLKFYFPWISEILLECSVKKKKKSGQISFHYLKKKKGKVTEAISSDNA